MADMRFLEADHKRAELRQAQPLRHLTAQDAAFGFGAAYLAFASDDKDEGQAVSVGVLQECEQGVMGTNLSHAVEIEPGVDLVSSA
jgi:hypothetical protein